MEKIAVLGSTGSIGTNGLDVISTFPDRFKVCALSTNTNIELLSTQVKRFKPEAVCIGSPSPQSSNKKGGLPRRRVPCALASRHEAGSNFALQNLRGIRVYEGEDGLCRMLEDIKIDTVLVAIVGSSALLPILTALDRVKKIALANKEALVMAGNIIMKKADRRGVKIVPVDSEHSAIFQLIGQKNKSEVRKIYLTGSGGPLLGVPKSRFKDISVKKAINHPKWKMGKKISVDSATMMNKGLEVIEAHWLFGLAIDKINILIHPETIVHSMVEFIDGSIMAQLGICDMRSPIQYSLTYPDRLDSRLEGLSFSKIKQLNFYKPDFKKFPCLELAYYAGQKGGTYPCVLNASNEVSVEEFIEGRIKFTDIPNSVEKVLKLHKGMKNPGLEDILEADKWARCRTKELFKGRERF